MINSKKYFGDKAFYRRVIALTMPIMIQNGITNFVSMLDNIMVGRVGTLQMTGVSVVNTLVFVFNLCVFGAVSGAGIFGAQFFGKGDHEGVRHSFRIKIISGFLIAVLSIAIFLLWGENLISLYLHGEGTPGDIDTTLHYALDYLKVTVVGLIPFALTQCYSSTLRENNRSLPPMVAGVIAVCVNLFFNYVLIFGKFGAPALGIVGAAIATVLSRFVELGVISVWTYRHRAEQPFIVGAFRSFKVPLNLVKKVFLKGLPLMLNETAWAGGLAILTQCYSERGLDVVAAYTISQTAWNVFNVSFVSIGVAIGILLGQILGAGEPERAKEEARKLIAFSLMVSVGVGIVYIGLSFVFPLCYNTTAEIRMIATQLMLLSVAIFPIDSFANATYFTLRSGGQVLITILFDSVFTMAVMVPVAFVLSRFSDLNILYLYAVVNGTQILKDLFGYVLVKKGYWIRNIVS